MKMPETIGTVHFVGIGGIGMSGIAEALHTLGYQVQGSDQAENPNVVRLREKGIEVFVGHAAENLGEAEVIVVSTAIKKDNPELVAAREKHLPIVRRAEMLAELMRFRQAVATRVLAVAAIAIVIAAVHHRAASSDVHYLALLVALWRVRGARCAGPFGLLRSCPLFLFLWLHVFWNGL